MKLPPPRVKKPRKISRGKFAGLTAITISKLMGSSIWKAKQSLYKLNKPITLEQLGELIYEFRLKKDSISINKYLNW